MEDTYGESTRSMAVVILSRSVRRVMVLEVTVNGGFLPGWNIEVVAEAL